mmetsp:Transcript_17991/g.52438  ORF Transcript_17991/g.52438 Transcript_17991/m.52438 type:complete len:192 (-) Transcript_17991:82-657(-)
MSPPRLFPAAAVLLGASASAYILPPLRSTALRRDPGALRGAEDPEPFRFAEERGELLGVAAFTFSIGAAFGWLNSHRREAAAAAAAAAVTVAPGCAGAIVDYSAIKYLGGSDKVDINNANVQAFRQFPGMYPTAAGAIATHGPYQTVSDIYNIPGLDERVKAVMKKYEESLVVMPPSPAYVLDRVNNGMYR